VKNFDSLIEQARKSVEKMTDADLRGKAFEVILAHLIEGGGIGAPNQAVSGKNGKSRKEPAAAFAPAGSTLPGRIVSLKGDGFFKSQRALSEVQDELRKRGWHYPVTSLSGPMQLLVRQRELRREQVKDGNKKIWKYSNY
jgi:hypothetical protein